MLSVLFPSLFLCRQGFKLLLLTTSVPVGTGFHFHFDFVTRNEEECILRTFSNSQQVELQMVMQSRSLDEGCGLQKVFHVVVPQLLLQRCSMGPLLPSGFSEEDAEL